jgi:hypothetical protein
MHSLWAHAPKKPVLRFIANIVIISTVTSFSTKKSSRLRTDPIHPLDLKFHPDPLFVSCLLGE